MCFFFLSSDDVAVDPTLDPNRVLPSAVNEAAVAKETAKVTVTAKKRRNESDRGHALGHAHRHPQDQRHGHAPPQ